MLSTETETATCYRCLLSSARPVSSSEHFPICCDLTVGGLSDVLFTSPILTEASAPQAPNQQGASPAAPDFAEYGGINPQLDPELAMALKMSAEVKAPCMTSSDH